LKKLILENLVKERYEKAEMSFRFWSFPFFEKHQINLKDEDSNKKIIIKNIIKKLEA
jgi:hypothetical protein